MESIKISSKSVTISPLSQSKVDFEQVFNKFLEALGLSLRLWGSCLAKKKPAAQAADADPPPLKLHQQAKSSPSTNAGILMPFGI